MPRCRLKEEASCSKISFNGEDLVCPSSDCT